MSESETYATHGEEAGLADIGNVERTMGCEVRQISEELIVRTCPLKAAVQLGVRSIGMETACRLVGLVDEIVTLTLLHSHGPLG